MLSATRLICRHASVTFSLPWLKERPRRWHSGWRLRASYLGDEDAGEDQPSPAPDEKDAGGLSADETTNG